MTDPTRMTSRQIWDRRFGQSDFLFGTEPNAYLAGMRHYFESGKTALVVADGEGRNSVWLAQQGLSVDAFDISSVGVEKAKKLANERSVNVNFNVCDVNAWNWKPESHDYVVAIFIQFADPEMRTRLFANMINALKPGGVLILQGYRSKQLEYNTGGPGILDNLYSIEQLRGAFADLQLLDLQEYDAVLQEGSQHCGISALIGMVGRKPAT